jgi:hypothetical protein
VDRQRVHRCLREFLEYKKRGIEKLTAHEKAIVKMAEQEKAPAEEESD